MLLFADRRQALLTICIAAMQMAWLSTFVYVFTAHVWTLSLAALYGVLLGGLIGWLLALDVLSRLNLPSPRYELSVAGLILLTTLAGIRLLVYVPRPATDVSWLWHTIKTLFELSPGIGRLAAVVLVNVLLWQRAAGATSRSLSFFSVGLSFRGGMLLLFLGGVLVHTVAGEEALFLLWCFFGTGLLAVALARIDEKANRAASVGALLPLGRLAQVLLAVSVTVGLSAAASLFYTRRSVAAALNWLSPVFDLLSRILIAFLTLLFYLLLPVLEWFERALRLLVSRVDLTPLLQFFQQLSQLGNRPVDDRPPVTAFVPGWVWTGMRYLVIAFVLLLLFAFVLIFLERSRRAAARRQK